MLIVNCLAVSQRLMESLMAEKTKEKPKNEKEPEAGGTDLATQSQAGTDVAVAEEDFFADAGSGLEDFKQSDLLIPYVRIIQALSKELQRNHAKFIQGAEQGQFVNSATRKLYPADGKLLVVPVSFGHRYMAWRPNNAGPAYDMGADDSKFNSTEPDGEGKRFDGEGNQLTDSLQFFTLLINKETNEFEVAVLNFGGSQSRKGKGWASQINNRMERYPAGNPRAGELMRPAIWFYSYELTTVPESNDKGSWYGFSIAEGPKVMGLPNGKEIFRTASELRKRIEGGEVKAAVESPDTDADADQEERAF